MQPVPPLGVERIAAQLVVAGDAPDIGRNGVLLSQNLLSLYRFIQDGARAEELYLRCTFFGSLVLAGIAGIA